jgi:flagellar hook-associated protein 2
MASGLPPNIVDQLVDAERIPIKTEEEKKGKQEARLKLVTDLETKLNTMRDSLKELAGTHGFHDMLLQSGDNNVVQGVVDPNAGVTGSWNIEVVDLPQKAAAITNGFPDKDHTEIGVGYFEFDTPQGKKEVYINGDNNTLEGAANAINSANVGLRATVLNDRKDADYPFKLMISGVNVGGDNQVSYPTLYFLDGDQDLYFDETREAKNGKVKVDGFEFEVDDNKVEGVIPGVTLELKQANPGRSINVSVKENMEVVSGKIKTFVDGVNGVLGFIQQQNTLDSKTDTSATLGGDGLLRSLENRIRSLIQNPQYGVNGSIKRLNEVGIEFNRSGTLTFDEKKFNSTLMRDPASVQAFLAGDGFSTGFIASVKREVGTMLDSNFGPVAQRKKGLRDRIDQMDDHIANQERRLATKEQSLRRKFAHLEETMSRLKSQMGAVGALGGGGGGALPGVG